MRSIVLLLGSLLLAGCALGTDTHDETIVARAADGLSILEADESAGKLTALFRKDGRQIRYELLLGPKNEVPPGEDEAGLPEHEIDARVLDDNGQIFYMQMGGDRFLDPSWRMPTVENVDVQARTRDFALMLEAAPAFQSARLPGTLSQLALAAMHISRSVEHLGDKPQSPAVVEPADPSDGVDSPAPPEVQEPSDPLGGGALAPQGNVSYYSSAYYWDYQIWWKYVSVTYAEHSAVRLRAFSSGKSVIATFNSCNHGTCAGYSPMQVHCTMSGYRTDDGTHSRYFYYESSSTSTVTGGCTTAYSAVFDNYKHVCNDDSLLQRDAIYYDNPMSTTTGTCADTYKRYGAPSCH